MFDDQLIPKHSNHPLEVLSHLAYMSKEYTGIQRMLVGSPVDVGLYIWDRRDSSTDLDGLMFRHQLNPRFPMVTSS